jgi:hypothetical protein
MKVNTPEPAFTTLKTAVLAPNAESQSGYR